MITGTTEHLTLDEFKAAVASAQPYATIVYATGDLAFDSHHHRNSELCVLSDYILPKKPNRVSQFILMQRRLGPYRFQYRATVLPAA